MTDKIDIRITSTYDRKGAAAALKDAQALQQAQVRGSSGSNSAAVSQANAMTAAQARAAQTTAKVATETQRLATETQRTAAAQARAETNALRLAQAQDRAAAAQARGTQGLVALPRTIHDITGPALTAVQAITGISGALVAVGKGIELAQLGARAELLEQRFNSMAAAAGESGDAILGALRKASGGEISDLNIQLAANKANLLGVATSAEQLGTLMAIARDRAQAMGISTEFAFDSIVTGLGRGSALILDNIGITVEAAEINAAYAASIGKTTLQLTEAEKKQALINAVVAQGNATLAATGGAIDGAASSFAQLGAASENASASLGKLLAQLAAGPAQAGAGVLSWVSEGIGALADADAQLKQIAASTIEASQSFDEYVQKQAFVNEQLAQFGTSQTVLTESQYEYAKSLIESGQSADQAYTSLQQLAAVIEAGSQASTTWGEGSNDLRDSMVELAGTSEQNRVSVQALSEQYLAGTITGDTLRAAIAALSEAQSQAAQLAAYDAQEQARLTDTHITAALAAQNSATQSLIDAQAKEEEAAKTALLTAQTQAAVDEFLRLNPTLSATAVAAVGAANGLTPLQIQLAQTTIRANEAQGALANFQRQAAATAGMGGLTPNRGLRERGPVGGRLGGGAGSTAAADRMRANAAISAYYPTVEVPKARRGGGGGGGSAAAADTKLRDAEIKEYQQREDALRAHQDRMLEIEADFNAKSEQQARKNEVSKRKSRADFYDDLTSVTEDIGGEAAQALSAEYEAAYAESQKMAQAGNKKLAADYLEMREEQISAEADHQQAVAEARKEGNEAEAQRLEAIQAMRRDANAEELKQLTEGGDELVNERQAALDAEAEKYGEQVGKIETAAQRKEDALTRSYQNSATAASQWASDIERASDRATKAIEGIPDVSMGTASATVGVDGVGSDTGATAGDTGGGQGLANANRRGLSGGPRASSGGGGGSSAVATLTEAHAILDQIVALGGIAKKYIKPIELYKQTLGTAVELLSTVADFHVSAGAAVSSPISADLIVQLVAEARLVLDLVRHSLVPTNERAVEIFERYASTVQSSIGVLSDMADLRVTLTEAMKNSQPFDMVAVVWLARRAQEFTALVLSMLIPLTERQATAMEQYASGVESSIAIIGGLADLRRQMTEAMKGSQPFDTAQIQFLIIRAKQFVEMVRQQLLPISEAQAGEISNYATAVESAVSIIGGLAGLRQTVTEAMKDSAPFDSKQIAFLAGRAKEFTALVRSQLIPLTEEQAGELTRWADGVSAAVSVIGNMADLRATTPGPPIDEAWVRRMAGEAKRIVELVRGQLTPTTEAQADELSRWADAVNAAVSAAAAPLDLSARMFEDYVSPSNAQLDLVVRDAKRLTDRLMAAAATYSTEGLEAGKAYAEGVGATFGAFNEGLVFIDRLRFSDLSVDTTRLAQFQASTLKTLDALAVLGQRAVAIPPANLAALQTANAALTSTADAMISMAAVPFGNLPAISANLGAMGGGNVTNSYQFNNTFVLPAGSTQQMAREILTIVDKQMRSHR